MIEYIDRVTGKREKERVYGETALRLLYGRNIFSRFLRLLTTRFSLFSHLYGKLQTLPSSKKKIAPFIEKFAIDIEEFEKTNFHSFNDFFCRRLKPEARPIAEPICMPADGRYLFYENVEKADGFIVKGQKFCLKTLLGDEKLADKYAQGSMVMARLCPTDYHRFHFPVDCIPQKPHLINGFLHSVNPFSLKQNVHRIAENKRMITPLKSAFGEVLFLEIGATNVGSIHQTFEAQKPYRKGDEKGYFSFGGSAIILLFEPSKIIFDSELLEFSKNHIEVRCLMGQLLARPIN